MWISQQQVRPPFWSQNTSPRSLPILASIPKYWKRFLARYYVHRLINSGKGFRAIVTLHQLNLFVSVAVDRSVKATTAISVSKTGENELGCRIALVDIRHVAHSWLNLNYYYLTGAGQKTPEICVSGSSTKKWRHIRFKLCRAARFIERKNGVSIGEDFPLFANHQVRVLSYWG